MSRRFDGWWHHRHSRPRPRWKARGLPPGNLWVVNGCQQSGFTAPRTADDHDAGDAWLRQQPRDGTGKCLDRDERECLLALEAIMVVHAKDWVSHSRELQSHLVGNVQAALASIDQQGHQGFRLGREVLLAKERVSWAVVKLAFHQRTFFGMPHRTAMWTEQGVTRSHHPFTPGLVGRGSQRNPTRPVQPGAAASRGACGLWRC